MKILKTGEKNIIFKIVFALKQGKILVLPTDTVYGLVCDARDNKAVEKIFKIKQRNKDNPLGIFAKDLDMIKEYAEVGPKNEKIFKKYFPGKITFILKKKKDLARGVGTKQSLGIRVSNYPLLKKIFKEIDFPIAQTSANLSGQGSQIKIDEIIASWQDKKNTPDLIIGAGDLKESLSSTVVDLTDFSPKILRQGEAEFKLGNF